MTGFTKLFSGIVFSTVWREEMHVKIVWVTMLALADRNGCVNASVPGLADASRVTIDQCRNALDRFLSPDTDSRTKEHEGRRIEIVDGGWRILNYLKYRELMSKDERRIKGREYVAKHRASKQMKADVSAGNQSKHIAEAEAEAEGVLPPASLRSAGTAAFQRLRDIATGGDLRHVTMEQLAWMGDREKAGMRAVGGLPAIKAKKPEHLRFMQEDFVQAYIGAVSL